MRRYACLQERIRSSVSDLDREIETCPEKNEKGVDNYIDRTEACVNEAMMRWMTITRRSLPSKCVNG